MTIQIEKLEELQELVASNPRVVVDFQALDWCQPCKRLAPHFHAAEEKLSDWTFVEVDIDHAEEIRAAYGIMTVPTLKKFVNGVYVDDVKGRTVLQLVNELENP